MEKFKESLKEENWKKDTTDQTTHQENKQKSYEEIDIWDKEK